MAATATHDLTGDERTSHRSADQPRTESSEAERRFAERVRRFAWQDRLFAGVTFGFAALVLLSMAGLMISLLIEAWPAFREYGVGFFYGTTEQGGYGGEIFRMDAAGNFTVIHRFDSYFSDGGRPLSGLIEGRDGFLYGTTPSGGQPVTASRYGVVYRMDKAAGVKAN